MQTVYYELHPNLATQDTLFIHGNLASHRWWHPTLEEWRKAGSQGSGALIFSDWRGCGKNDDWAQDKPFTIEDLARDKIALMDRLGKDKVALVGHSLGGLIALQMMAIAPERFTKALLLDPVGAKGVVFDESMYEAFRQMAASFDLTRMVILSTVLNSEELEDKFKGDISNDAFKAVKGIGTSVLEILKTVDLREAAKNINVPTLIVHGAKDGIIPAADSEALAGMMPQSQLEILENHGHCWNVENPRTFTERVRQWI